MSATAARTVPVAGPWITDAEVEAVAAAARDAWYERAGSCVAAFEVAFAAAVGRRHALALPSCTSGLHLALAALGVGPGDEVVVPDTTWIATAAPIAYVGATPRFVEVDPATWCLDLDAVAAAVGPRTRAVVAVDLYGAMADLDALALLCADAGVALVEDAAEALGSTLRGRPAGAFGSAAAFSFHGSKTLTTGEGGMVVTDDGALAARMAVLRDHGRQPGDTSFQNGEVAFKYKMSDVQAALGHAQLGRLHELVERKRSIHRWYEERLGGLPLELSPEGPGVRSSRWMATALLDDGAPLDGPGLRGALEARGVATRPCFSPLSGLPAYAGHPQAGTAADQRPVAHRLGRRALNLPSALRLDEGDVDHVCSALREVLA